MQRTGYILTSRLVENKMSFKHQIRKLLWNIGYDISSFSPTFNSVARKRKLFEAYNIDIVLDVGANTGQFAEQLRGDIGYSGRIASFEPMSSAFQQLQKNALGEHNWEIFNFALGDTIESRKINLAGNSQSSSILKMLPAHENAAPNSKYIGVETINVKTLDSLFNELCSKGESVYLKIDTQGFESKVISGAENSLKEIDTVELEMSLVPLYEGGALFLDMCGLMIAKGFSLVSIENVFSDDKTGRLLQMDGIFHRAHSN